MGDLIISVCHATSRDHVLKSPYNVMDEKLFTCFMGSYHPIKIGENKQSGGEDMFLICHVKEL